MPKVHNKHHHSAPPDAVYVGRGSPFGNPFVIGPHGNRDQVCGMFEAHVRSHPELEARIKRELRGKDLVCFCKPARCHGDFLLTLANEEV